MYGISDISVQQGSDPCRVRGHPRSNVPHQDLPAAGAMLPGELCQVPWNWYRGRRCQNQAGRALTMDATLIPFGAVKHGVPSSFAAAEAVMKQYLLHPLLLHP